MEGAYDPAVLRSSNRMRDAEEQSDWVSQLPEPILVHILSCLPTWDVVKMAFVPRFRHVWTLIRNLSFDQCAFHDHNTYNHHSYDGPYYDEGFLSLIRHVLILHESNTIDQFCLKFWFNLLFVKNDGPHGSDEACKERRMARELTAWIMFAVRKRVKVLDLNLLGCSLPEPEVNYELPNIVLKSDYLMELILAGCGIKEYGCINLKSLRKLSLKEIMLNDNIMNKIIKGCPLLEELSLIRCPGLHKLMLTNPSTKRLDICIGWKDEVANLVLEIICPHIKSLVISGSIQLADLNASSSLVYASLYYDSVLFKCACKRYNSVRTLLWKLSQTDVCVLCTNTILLFTIWAMTNVQAPFFSSESLVLRLSFTKWHLPGLHSILRNSTYLKTLTFYIYPGSHSIFLSSEAMWMKAHDFVAENYWKFPENGFLSVMIHLKTVMIYGCVTEPYVFELIEFLLKKALVLEKMVISNKKRLQPMDEDDQAAADALACLVHHITSEKLSEFSQKVLRLPKASTSAVIQVC